LVQFVQIDPGISASLGHPGPTRPVYGSPVVPSPAENRPAGRRRGRRRRHEGALADHAVLVGRAALAPGMWTCHSVAHRYASLVGSSTDVDVLTEVSSLLQSIELVFDDARRDERNPGRSVARGLCPAGPACDAGHERLPVLEPLKMLLPEGPDSPGDGRGVASASCPLVPVASAAEADPVPGHPSSPPPDVVSSTRRVVRRGSEDRIPVKVDVGVWLAELRSML